MASVLRHLQSTLSLSHAFFIKILNDVTFYTFIYNLKNCKIKMKLPPKNKLGLFHGVTSPRSSRRETTS